MAFTEVLQAPAIRILPSTGGLGGPPRDQASGPDASDRAAGSFLEPTQQQLEASWESGGGRKAPVAGALSDEPARGLEIVSGLDELLGEDSIDQELEQLYLSHLSRLRAVAAGGEGSPDGGTSPSHPLGILTDRDLILKWPGPERALNSALAEEITLHYARLGCGVELIKDTEDPDDEGDGEEGLSITPSSPEGDNPKESPPEILSGARSVIATMGDVWVPWAERSRCASPVVLGTQGQFTENPERGIGKDTDSVLTNRVIVGVTKSPGEAGTESQMEVPTGQESGLIPISEKALPVPVQQEQKPAPLAPTGTEVALSSVAMPRENSQDEERSPLPVTPAECACGLAPQLRGPLTQTLGVLAGLVMVPVVLNSGMSLLVLVLCLFLAWFS